ncbi:peptidoglycan DD-transpeptidase MrdA [Rosenbergiella australiborealis]|uniref:Peptidoglycan D,D-transpeptidase MrdA n=1 Tax=Rosenbergiella australiborealis TaxID=1544696 RepID=A0ABS5T7T9_9GAMM|nr:peptidoglycan DD-transpeptidase MrdA [Rosenbergiella australiborealis]MBT0728440.1 peptidoglycan DD-transpeptidase MrdA [Rosenbergiella australiborealis]
MKLTAYAFRDYSAEQKVFVKRAAIALVGVFLLISLLVINLCHLQIIKYNDYRTRSNQNRIKLVPVAPSRGIIYDRNGIPLALNRTIYQAEILPAKVGNLAQTLKELQPILSLNEDDLIAFEKDRKQARRFTPVVVKYELNDEQIARFAVNQYRFPGVEIKGYQRRYYPYGPSLTHIVGYVSKINDHDLIRLNNEQKAGNYTASHDIGKLGIEAYYEDILHGTTGYEEVEVNNRGRVVRQLNEVSPQAGEDITLTLDLALQQYIETLLSGSRGAVVVSDPRNGDILAMVSMPSYDPNLFVEGISSKDYKELLTNPDRPLYNRAIQAAYPPASTVKPFVAVSALSTGVITKNSSLVDPGWWQLPGTDKRFRDWKKWGHGRLNVTKSLEESADTFFYQVAFDMGIDRLSEWMTKFGYGRRTGIDLPQESAGNMPTREWKLHRFKKPWYQGDTIPVGIGQGYWTATPLQMNKALMALINDGVVKVPHLLLSANRAGISEPYRAADPESIGEVHSGHWEIAKDGMYGVANRPNGTAHKSFIDAPYKIAAKSGTAQVFGLKANETYNANKISERLRDHKLMTAFAPYDNPRVAITMIVENGGSGPAVGTIMRQILDHIMLGDNNTQLPSESSQHSGDEGDE